MVARNLRSHLLCYPLLRWLLTGLGKRLLDALAQFLALPGAVYVPALPVAGLMVKLNPRGFWGMRDYGGWPLLIYLLSFLYGFILISHDGLRKPIQQQRWISLIAGVLCFLAFLPLWASRGDPSFGSSRYLVVYEALIRRVGILRFLFGMKSTTQNRTAGLQKTSASGAKA